MSYSRRDLEALGEPLGASVTREKPGGRIYGGGGPEAPPPAPTQTTTLSIPEYARPQAERLIGRAEALTTSPYQTYGGQRVATASPEQQQARQTVAQAEVPGQFGVATGLAGTSGFGSIGAGQQGAAAGQVGMAAGQQGMQTGMQGLNYGSAGYGAGQAGMAAGMQGMATGQAATTAGRDYMMMATNPAFQQAFMSPYMQNVVDVQKNAAIRDAQRAQLAQNLGAARQGTYGGARQLLATTERERALGSQLADIQAKGQQSAYEQALDSMRYGVETGLRGTELGIRGAQTGIEGARTGISGAGMGIEGVRAGISGAQTGIQGAQTGIAGSEAALRGFQQAGQSAQTMGQLGAAEQEAMLNLARAQETFGGLGQAERQRALDLAYQDFLTQQQHPYKQIGFMSDILRGSSNLTATGGKAVYEAPPSQLSQIVGPGLLGLGVYREFMQE